MNDFKSKKRKPDFMKTPEPTGTRKGHSLESGTRAVLSSISSTLDPEGVGSGGFINQRPIDSQRRNSER